MNIKQVSVFLENKKGRLADVSNLLAMNNINIRALSLADTAEFGVLRLIVDGPERCISILKQNHFVAQVTDVIAVQIMDQPGGLDKILKLFNENNINIEYMYAFVEKKEENAIVVFRVEDYRLANDCLIQNSVPLITEDEVKKM